MTAAARDGAGCAQVGTEGWCRSNKRMGLPDTASRTVYRIREGEVPILSATITVMKKISFRSILLRPSNCTRLIRSHDFKPLCCRWNRPIFWATLTMETNRKPSRIVIRKYGESHQLPCSGSIAVMRALRTANAGRSIAQGTRGTRRSCRSNSRRERRSRKPGRLGRRRTPFTGRQQLAWGRQAGGSG